VRDAAGGLLYYEYDALGRRVALTDQRGHTMYFAYDPLSRLVSEFDPLGNATYYTYDPLGNLISRTDLAGVVYYFRYDPASRLECATNPAGESTYFSYDRSGNLTSVQNGRGNPTYFMYDALANLAAETDAVGATVYYEYGRGGNMVCRIDAQGRAAYFTYDPLGRLIGRAYEDGAIAYFTLDAAGRTVSMQDDWGVSYFTYDQLGRLISRRWPDGASAYYEYDAESNLTALTGPDGGTTYYEYGPMGRMERLHTARGGWAYYDYDATGQCIRRHNPNGTVVYFTYDATAQLTGIRHLKADLSPICYFDYRYDTRGLITSIAREGGIAIYYDYDDANRLTGERWQGPDGELYALSYGYDAAGNRAWKAVDGVLTYYAYAAAERLAYDVSQGKYTYYSYDRNGSCTRIESPDRGQYTYFEYWDSGLVKTAHMLPEDRWNYFYYDGQGTRYCIQDSEGTKYYYWDGLNLLERRNATNGTVRSFTQGYTPTPGIGNMIEYAESGQEYSFHFDARGTVFAITDASQAVEQTYEHDAWGVKLSEAGSLENPIQYQGCAWLAQRDFQGSYLSPTREYLAPAARSLRRDAVRHMNRFAYSRDCPTLLADPDGLIWVNVGKPYLSPEPQALKDWVGPIELMRWLVGGWVWRRNSDGTACAFDFVCRPLLRRWARFSVSALRKYQWQTWVPDWAYWTTKGGVSPEQIVADASGEVAGKILERAAPGTIVKSISGVGTLITAAQWGFYGTAWATRMVGSGRMRRVSVGLGPRVYRFEQWAGPEEFALNCWVATETNGLKDLYPYYKCRVQVNFPNSSGWNEKATGTSRTKEPWYPKGGLLTTGWEECYEDPSADIWGHPRGTWPPGAQDIKYQFQRDIVRRLWMHGVGLGAFGWAMELQNVLCGNA